VREYSFTQARQHFASILDEAKKEGIVCIKKQNGESFYIKPAMPKESPLDVEGVDLGVTSLEIVDAVRQGREKKYRE